jgi:hypothetical protein
MLRSGYSAEHDRASIILFQVRKWQEVESRFSKARAFMSSLCPVHLLIFPIYKLRLKCSHLRYEGKGPAKSLLLCTFPAASSRTVETAGSLNFRGISWLNFRSA